jgi:hypothetical protein
VNKTIYAVALVVLAAVAGVVGCGGGSDTTGGSSAPPLSKAELMRKGNALCQKAVSEESSVYVEYVKEARQNGKPTKEEFEAFATSEILPIAARMVRELDSLSPPKGEQAALDRLIQEFEDGLTVAENNVPRFFSGKAFKAADDSADEYGLTECGV